MSIKFDVPYNGDKKTIEYYIKNKEYIEMVYGRAEDGYPQGRKTMNGIQIDLKNIFQTNDVLLNEGIKFNYLLNGTSHGNQEYNKDYKKTFINHVKMLKDNGIQIVTIGNLLLLEAVIHEVPGIEVAASITLEIDSLVKLKTICKLGVKYIFISKVLLKNFNGLSNIHIFLQKNYPEIKIFLLANDPCLNHCVYTDYHNETLSLLTGENKGCNSFCRLQCTKKFSTDGEAIISASFIRPEDIKIYEDIGYNYIKLCDRKQTTEWLIKTIDAYIRGTYDGLLSDIMAPWSKHNGFYKSTKKVEVEDFIKEGLDKHRDNLRFSPKINNNDLDGYLNFWLKNKPNGCMNEDCNVCGYCKNLANKYIQNKDGALPINLNNAIKYCFK